MKKKFMGIALVLASALFVGHVSAESAWDGSSYGKVTDITGKEAYIGTKPVAKISPEQNEGVKDITFTYDLGDFRIVEGATETPAGPRPEDNSWIGISVTRPNNVESKQYKVYINGEENVDYYETNDNNHYFQQWLGISLKKLEENVGGYITYVIGLDWNSDGDPDQTVTIKIDTMKINLYAKGADKTEGTEPVWSPTIAAQKLADKKAAEEAAKKAEEEKAEKAKVAEVVTAEEDGVTITGTMLKEDNEAYKTMLEKATEKGFKTVFGAYELTKEGTIGEKGLTLTFKVGTENNGRAAYILHQKGNGTIEEFNAVVTDGVVKINVSELSPFMVALGDVVKVKDAAPGTGDVFPIAIVGMITLGLAGTYTFRKLHN